MRISRRLACAAAAAFLAAGIAVPAQAQLKVGFVYVGPIGDHGWTYQHNEGRLAIEKALGSKVKTTYVEKVPEGADAQRVITRLASSGHGLIFTTSFGYMNPTAKVAKRFPKVKFEHATGYKRGANLATYSARFYEGRYVVGKIVGKMTKSNILGYVASFPIPEVIRGINATFLAARSVNPKIRIKIVWVSTWFDPGKEADAAKALIDQGADVIMQHTDSPAPVQVAEQRGVHGVVADAHHGWGHQCRRRRDGTGEQRPRQIRPLSHAGEQSYGGRERRAHGADREAGKHHEGHVEQRVHLDVANREGRRVAEERARDDGRGHGGQAYRDEARGGVLHQHDLHGEDDAGHGRVERTGDGGSDAARDEYPQALGGHSQALPEHARCRRAEVDGGTLATAGQPGPQRGGAGEELHDRVRDRQSAGVLAEPLQHVGDAGATVVFGKPGQRKADDGRAEQRHADP